MAPMILIGITIVTAGTFAEFALGQLGAAFNTDLGLPIADIGVLASVMFISGGVASIPAGWVIDRAPLVVMTLLQGVLAMVAFASFALVSGPMGLTIACAAVGVFMAFGVPLTNRMVALYLPRRAYAVVIGWKSVGPQVAAVLAGVTFGGTAGLLDWRTVVWVWVVLFLVATLASCWYLAGRSPYGDGVMADQPGRQAAEPTPAASALPAVGPWLFWVAAVLVGVMVLGSTPIPQVVLVQKAQVKRIGFLSSLLALAGFAGLAFQPWALSVVMVPFGFVASWGVMAACGLLASATLVIYLLVTARRTRAAGAQ